MFVATFRNPEHLYNRLTVPHVSLPSFPPLLLRTLDRLERNHKCGLCETRFGQKSDLRRHVQVVHEQQKNFGCEICGRAFGRRSSLSQHMQRVHSRKLPSLRESGRANVSSANRPDRGEVAMKKSEKMTDSAAVSEELQTAKSFDFGSICFE